MEEHDDLSIINTKPTRLVGPSLLHQLIQAPSLAPALEYLQGESITTLTYSQLHGQAAQLAASITLLCGEGGEASQPIVPVLLPQGPALYIALLAILKAGAAFCPLNLDAPEERIKFILGDLSAKVVITNEALRSQIPNSARCAIVAVDGHEQAIPSSLTPGRHVNPSDLAYVMYTSGSTGTPKGVGVSHDAATQALLAHDRHIPQFVRFLQFAAPTFDVSVFEIFFPLFRGSILASAPRTKLLDNLAGIMKAMNVDACELTPTVAASLLRHRHSVPQLQLLLTIGEMLNCRVIEEFGGNKEEHSLLWAMYGPTEATIHW